MAAQQPHLRSATFQSCGASVRAGDDPTFMSKPDETPECHNCAWCGYPLTERGYMFDELREVLLARGVDVGAVLEDMAARMPLPKPKNIPVGRSMRSRANHRVILTRGSACSHACVLAHIVHGNAANADHTRAFAVEAAVLEGCSLEDIVPAPPREALLRNGGDMSYGAFRLCATPAQPRGRPMHVDLLTSPVYEHCPHSFEKRVVGDEHAYQDLFASVLTTDGTTPAHKAAGADRPKRAAPKRKKATVVTAAPVPSAGSAPLPPAAAAAPVAKAVAAAAAPAAAPPPTPPVNMHATAANAKRKTAPIDAYFIRMLTQELQQNANNAPHTRPLTSF